MIAMIAMTNDNGVLNRTYRLFGAMQRDRLEALTEKGLANRSESIE
ncbi:hypothetical protein [Pantoea sp. Fr+CA_20]|nr:hypothetical protein [Pantoea sp. Fr+CA_20]